MAAAGGPSDTICQIDALFDGANWGADDTIVFAEGSLGLFRVRASGGQPEKLAMPDPGRAERAYVGPVTLPGGRAFLYTVVLTNGSTRIASRRLDGSDGATLVEGGFGPQYLPSGHLIYGEGDRLMAVRFDASTLHISGSPAVVQTGVFTKPLDGVSNVAVAADGTMVYLSGRNAATSARLVWIDQHGGHARSAADQLLDTPRNPRLSPDGRRVAVTIGPGGQGHIWVYDLAGAVQPVRLTFRDHNIFPSWSPDGRRIAFFSRSSSTDRLLSIPSDGSAVEPVPLTTGAHIGLPLSWSRDGAFLLFEDASNQKLWLLRVGDGSVRQWLQTPFDEFGGRFSSDGHWVAYTSNQTGTPEVWVRPFPGPGAPVRVSPDGGTRPMWSRDDGEIYYQKGRKMFAARVVLRAADFRVDTPRPLFEGGFQHDDTDPNIRFIDVAPDGRFLAVEPTDTSTAASIVLTRHWEAEAPAAAAVARAQCMTLM